MGINPNCIFSNLKFIEWFYTKDQSDSMDFGLSKDTSTGKFSEEQG